MSQVKSKQITQPEDWWQLFSKQASLEGLTLSEWVGLACKDRVLKAQEYYDQAEETETTFSPRPRKGPAKGTKYRKEPKGEN